MGPRKVWQPNCRVCGFPLRRQNQGIANHPGTRQAAVIGLCPQHYQQVRKGVIVDPERPFPTADPDVFTWRRSLNPDELTVLVQLRSRFPLASEDLLDLAGALGLRSRGGTQPSEYVGQLNI